MERTGKTGLKVLLAWGLTAGFVCLLLLKPAPLETLEGILYDSRCRLRGGLTPPAQVLIVAIDEKSLERFGRWPWPRPVLTRLIERLSRAGAALIVLDLILSEGSEDDPRLARAVREAGNVVMPLVFDFDRPGTGDPGDPSLQEAALLRVEHPENLTRYPPPQASRIRAPVPPLRNEAVGLGSISVFPDPDGTLRREALLVSFEGYLFPSLTLTAAALFLGVPPEAIVVEAGEGIRLGSRHIPTDGHGMALIPYYGPSFTFKYLSVADILEGPPDRVLDGALVLVGATAVGLGDQKVTPVAPVMPGVEKHASVISAFLEGRALRQASLAEDLAFFLLAGIPYGLLLVRLKARAAALLTLGLLLVLLGAGIGAFLMEGLWLRLIYPVVSVLTVFVVLTAYNYAMEERFSRRIRQMFSSYVTERVVAELIRNPEMAKLGGERREITVLFSDIRGFTTFAERHSPEEVVAMLNEYLAAMTEVVFAWEGTLDKFIGDAIMAFWGAPMPQEDHAERALGCALDMVKRLRELQEVWASQKRPALDCGIGINTGEVLVGNIGAEGKKMDYTLIGDHVNLASRVESLTRRFDVAILVTAFTLERLRGRLSAGALGLLTVRDLGSVSVKGKEIPVALYEVRRSGGTGAPEESPEGKAP